MVRESRYEDAKKLLAEAREIDLAAHKIQTELITAEMSGGEDKPEIGY